MNFRQKIQKSTAQNNSLLCVGLDPDPAKMPAHLTDISAFNKAIIDATKDLVCAFKPNSAFYEAQGPAAIQALKDTCDYIKETAPDVPIILDYKRADIGNTNNGYIAYAFDYLGVDAVTVHPYMGSESIRPYLDLADKGIIVLCRTSNPGAGEFQDLEVNGKKLYQMVAERVHSEWDRNNNCALVVGATYPAEARQIRQLVGDDMLFLVPGIGAQGGNIEQSVTASINKNGEGIIVNSTRSIIYASGAEDFAEAARGEAQKLRDEINKYRGDK